MTLNKNKLKTMSIKEIKKLIKQKGSVFVSSIENNKFFVQHIFIGDKSIHSLEYSPNEQFEQILPHVWYREYILPHVDNLSYLLFKNCEKYKDEIKYEKERVALLVFDKYSKNILRFYDANGKIYFKRTYILPIKKIACNKLKSKKVIFYSKSLNEDREIIIEYPKGYKKGNNSKILILTDGLCWKYTMHFGQELGMEKSLSNIILCYVLQKNRNTELPNNKSFCKFISIDLLNFLYKKLNISNDKENFIFCGQSFGGLTALGIDMYYPDRIGTIICQSASLWNDKRNKIFNYYKSNKIKSNMYFSYGNCEINQITNTCEKFKDVIKQKNFYFKIFSGGHDYISWKNDLITTLKSLF